MAAKKRPRGRARSLSRFRRTTKRRIATWVVVAAGVAASLLAIAFLASTRSDDATRGTTVGGGDGVAHVHGLGINPADGDLYAATHHGLFRVPEDGRAERVGNTTQDTMGFTVVGGAPCLASGHPDLQDKRLRAPRKPPLLGLIESRDAGRTWEPLSLLGEADFHSLVAVHGNVYGYDSSGGRLMVSADGEEWEVRSALGIADFAVDPADPDHLVAMTDRGLAQSGDGGRTWSSVGGPHLAFLTWNARQGLWGVDLEGQTYQWAGEAWRQAGALPGRPQALLVSDTEIYAAADDGERTGLYVSTDAGRTWRLRYAD